jgi:hypothetical protein
MNPQAPMMARGRRSAPEGPDQDEDGKSPEAQASWQPEALFQPQARVPIRLSSSVSSRV